MTTDSVIEARDGRLFIFDTWQTDWTRPVQYRAAWPTGLRESNCEHLVGQTCRYIDNGIYQITHGPAIALEHRGQTKTSQEHTEERPIPRPKGRTTYRHGKWIR